MITVRLKKLCYAPALQNVPSSQPHAYVHVHVASHFQKVYNFN